MLTLGEIRMDLKEIRYYYSRRSALEGAFHEVGKSTVLQTVARYNASIVKAPIRLFDLYVALYVNNFTQEGLAVALGYTTEYVQMQHKKLLLFFQKELVDT